MLSGSPCQSEIPVKKFAVLLLCSTLAACSGSYRDTSVPIDVVSKLDVQRYTGLWFEYARFPVFFQRGCTDTTAEYQIIAEDTVSVYNRCLVDSGTRVKDITGQATIEGVGKLQVSFPQVPFVKSPYWVLWVDDGYEIAVVGTPNGSAGWILSRSKQPSQRLVDKVRSVLSEAGYDLTKLEITPHAMK